MYNYFMGKNSVSSHVILLPVLLFPLAGIYNAYVDIQRYGFQYFKRYNLGLPSVSIDLLVVIICILVYIFGSRVIQRVMDKPNGIFWHVLAWILFSVLLMIDFFSVALTW